MIGLACAFAVGFAWFIAEILVGDPRVAFFYFFLPFAAAAIPLGAVGLVGLLAGFMARKRSGDERDRERSSMGILLNTVPVVHVMCWTVVALVARMLANEMLGP